jgi:DNA-binding NarL/FixJ family response regulator
MPATILIVEDQELVRRALRKLLEVVYSRYHVIEAASGEEAVGLIKTEQPHLVIMDITLPGMNGIEATERIRAAHPTTPVVMLTIHEDKIYREKAESAGAIAYVPKRAIQSELLPQLTTLLANFQDK